jgi:hypothetical protein
LLVRALDLERTRAFAWCGLALGVAGACRPASFVVLPVVAVFLFVRDRRFAIALAAGALAPVALALSYNAVAFGSPFAFGQVLTQQQTGRSTFALPFEGMLGVLISPGRGLLVFSPVMGFALWGIVTAWRQRGEPRWTPIRILACAAGAIVLVETSHFDWWGGWTFGYRKIVDTMPFVVLGLVPFLSDLARRSKKAIGFAVAFAWSVAVQVLGVTAYDVDGWNARKVDGVFHDIDRPQYHDRLWSIIDSPIGYYATHWKRARAHRKRAIDIWIADPSA